MDIIIRQATKEDAPAFNDIIAACSEQLDEQGFSHWRYYYEPQTEDSKQKSQKNETQTFVATIANGKDERGKVIGCVCLDLNVQKDFFKSDYKVELDETTLAYITTLAVHPTMQNQGTGDKLMEFVENIARQKSKIPIITMRLEVQSLVDFYKRRNYVEIGRMITGENEQYSLLIKTK